MFHNDQPILRVKIDNGWSLLARRLRGKWLDSPGDLWAAVKEQWHAAGGSDAQYLPAALQHRLAERRRLHGDAMPPISNVE